MKLKFLELDDLLKGCQDFEPVAYYDDALGMLRVQVKDCRTTVEAITTGLEIEWELDDEGKRTGVVAGIAIYAPKLKLSHTFKQRKS